MVAYCYSAQYIHVKEGFSHPNSLPACWVWVQPNILILLGKPLKRTIDYNFHINI